MRLRMRLTPLGVSGLKWELGTYEDVVDESHPTRGEWIEI